MERASTEFRFAVVHNVRWLHRAPDQNGSKCKIPEKRNSFHDTMGSLHAFTP